jgi:undecaprenyl-diphosphatase
MNNVAGNRLWQRVDLVDHALCARMNRGCRYSTVRKFFAAISRLGDGVAWYVLMLGLALSGQEGATTAAQMAITGVIGAILYKQLKSRLVRERPYVGHAAILVGTAPLDQYSFPSGHTLHAVSFTTVASANVPELVPVLLPFTLLVAISRVVLGLHYPTDVAAGAVIGLRLAGSTLWLW